MLKKTPTRILVVMENFDYGGTTTHLINIINNSEFKNSYFYLLTNKNNKARNLIKKYCKNKKLKFIYYYSFKDSKISNLLVKIIYTILKPLLFICSIVQMYIKIKNLKFDIFLADCGGYGDFRSEMAAIIAGKILGKHNIFLLIHHCYTKPLLWSSLINFVNLIIGKYLSGIIFVSNATKETINKNTKLLKLFKNKSVVIHNGINLKKIKRKKLKIFNKDKKIYSIGMLARIEDYKGQSDLVDAFSLLPTKIKNKYKVFFVGNGDEQSINRLTQLIDNYRLSKFFKLVNYIEEDSLVILQNFDLFFSLTKDFEGFGYSIAEALYVSVPVVSTKVGGVTEFLNSRNSTLIEKENINSIIKVLKQFLNNKKTFKTKSATGRKLIIKRFNSKIMSKKFREYFIKYSHLERK